MSSPSPLTPSCLILSKIRSYRFLSFPAHRSSLTRFLTRSFDALELYIQTQKALLSRIRSDIDRLRLLREQATTDPEHFFDAFDEKVFFNYLLSSTHSIHTTHNSSMITSSTLIISLTSQRRFKKRLIGTYSKDKVRRLPLTLYHNLREKRSYPPSHICRGSPCSALCAIATIAKTAKCTIVCPATRTKRAAVHHRSSTCVIGPLL